jgi:hypothetical protein
MIEVINKILEGINQYANLLLTVITAVYAYMTFESVKIMRRQVTASIRISKVHIRVSAEGKKDGLKIDSFRDMARRPFGSLQETVFVFKVFIDFINISSGAGAIDQPKLIIRFAGSDFCMEVRPTSERIGDVRRTIQFSGGAFEKMDLDYFVSYNEKFISELKKRPDKIEYFLRYKDNSGKKHLVRINEIEGLK